MTTQSHFDHVRALQDSHADNHVTKARITELVRWAARARGAGNNAEAERCEALADKLTDEMEPDDSGTVPPLPLFYG